MLGTIILRYFDNYGLTIEKVCQQLLLNDPSHVLYTSVDLLFLFPLSPPRLRLRLAMTLTYEQML